MDAIKFYELFKTLQTIAGENKEGFTYNLKENKLQNNGYAVARRETQNSHNESGMMSCLVYALQNDVLCVGGWYDNKSGKYYFDATEIHNNKQEAEKAAKENAQLAYFDLNTCTEIRL